MVAVKSPVDVPVAIGIPVIAPLAAFNVKPDGNAPTTAKIGAGTPVAVSVNVYGVAYAPLGAAPLVNCGACVFVVFVSAKFVLELE